MKDGFVKANRIESGNYPKSSFVGKLTDIYFTEKKAGDTSITVLKVEFLDGKTYDIKAIQESDKSSDGIYGIHENGDYDEFMAIGQWLKSVEALDVATGMPNPDVNAKRITVGFGYLDGCLAGIDFDPEIRGCILYNTASPKTVGAPDQTSKYPDWTISKIDGLNANVGTKPEQPPAAAPAKRPGKLPPKTQTKEPETTTDLSDVVLNVLDVKTFKSIKTVFQELNKEYDPKDLRSTFVTLEADKFIIRDGDKYIKI